MTVSCGTPISLGAWYSTDRMRGVAERVGEQVGEDRLKDQAGSAGKQENDRQPK